MNLEIIYLFYGVFLSLFAQVIYDFFGELISGRVEKQKRPFYKLAIGIIVTLGFVVFTGVLLFV